MKNSEKNKVHQRKRNLIILVILIILVTILGGGYYFWNQNASETGNGISEEGAKGQAETDENTDRQEESHDE